MNILRTKSAIRRYLLLAVCLVLVLAAVLTILKWQAEPPSPAVAAPPSVSASYPGLDTEDPAPSFEVLRYVTDTPGDPRSREMAIVWLDEQAAPELPPSIALETWLLEMLQANGNPGWDIEYRLWLYNSAFNVLHFGREQEAFTRLLRDFVLHSDVRTMRLYALQHIGLQRDRSHLNGALAEEIYAMLQELVSASNSGVAGSAIALLAAWDGRDAAAPEVLENAVKIAAEGTRPVDVRVTALHTAASQGLPLARKLALDSAQPVILRKAAIACIGRHGGREDFPDLEKLSGENFRLAQASLPALRKIRDRLANPDSPELSPF